MLHAVNLYDYCLNDSASFLAFHLFRQLGLSCLWSVSQASGVCGGGGWLSGAHGAPPTLQSSFTPSLPRVSIFVPCVHALPTLHSRVSPHSGVAHVCSCAAHTSSRVAPAAASPALSTRRSRDEIFSQPHTNVRGGGTLRLKRATEYTVSQSQRSESLAPRERTDYSTDRTGLRDAPLDPHPLAQERPSPQSIPLLQSSLASHSWSREGRPRLHPCARSLTAGLRRRIGLPCAAAATGSARHRRHRPRDR